MLKVPLPLWHNRAILAHAELVLDGKLDELERLAEETRRFCAERALDSAVEFDLTLALEELFTNALRHGGCAGMERAVEIRLALAGDGVEVEFRDRGRPFDPAAAPPPDLDAPLDARPQGGLGVHLVRGIMCDLNYRRTGDWNRITMRRPLGNVVTGEKSI